MVHCVESTSYHSPKLHPGACSSVRMRRGTDGHTDTQTAVTNIHFASVTPHVKCNKDYSLLQLYVTLLHIRPTTQWYAYSTNLSTICRYLQTIHSSTPCTLTRWTSTSVRVSWPTRWLYGRTSYYRVVCTSRPGCGHTSIPRGRNKYTTTVSSLIPGTYYMFRVSSVPSRSQNPRVLLNRSCEGTTSLYQSYL